MNTEISSSTAAPLYVEVLLPLPLHATFTYRIPPEISGSVGIGYRVIVPFGRKKFYTGIVIGLPSKAPEGFETKDVALIVDDTPVIRHPQLKLWDWIADYYLCAPGEVYKAALPAGLKLESETFVEQNPDYDIACEPLTAVLETEIWQLLDHERSALSVQAIISKLEGKRGVASAINRMIERGVLIISEKLVERYRPKRETYVGFGAEASDMNRAFGLVKGAKKQEQLLLAMLELTRHQQEEKETSRDELLKRSGVSAAVLSAVVAKGVLRVYKKEINRFRFTGTATGALPTLSKAQSEALDSVHRSWKERAVCLLHGVTSSGKTELYIHLIDYVLRKGDQALYLVPEIALTTQLTRRLQAVFGDRVVIYHSRFTDNERVDIWKRLLNSSEPVVVIGARSSVFLPFSKLGVVIVDEEHDASYKQYDPAPRYNARDAAIVLASMHGAKTLLGSATPAIDTYYKASEEGKFSLVTLSERFGAVELPEIRVVNMQAARASKSQQGAFASETITLAQNALANGSQIILFQNRRGYAPLARCKQCAWVPRCEHCDVALTYHAHLRQLQCHYCGAVYPLPSVCPQCHEPSIETVGYGTERIAEETAEVFPNHKMLRMDLDTTRNKNSYANIIDDFSAKRASILVGTQMVTKGLDFAGVSMVGVLGADSIINFPDFRSTERAFAMLEQVAGRAGRRATTNADGSAPGRGLVVVQTYHPEHPVLKHLQAHDYNAHYTAEIAARKRYFYPPFSRIIYIYLRHRDASTLRTAAAIWADHLRGLLGERVYGPEEPAISRIQGLYIRKIMLKIEPAASARRLREILRGAYTTLQSMPQTRGLVIHYDVDPA